VRKGHFCYRHASFLHRASPAVESAPARRASQAKSSISDFDLLAATHERRRQEGPTSRFLISDLATLGVKR
jgi:hypothetical protein